MVRTSTASLFSLAFIAAMAFVALTFKDQRDEERISHGMKMEELGEKIIELRDSVDLVWHQELQLVCEFKDPKTHDFFVFWKIGNDNSIGYCYATTLQIKKSDLDYVLRTTKKHQVEWPFTLNTLWRESRFGTNTAHKVNYDGSKDGGPYGINSRYKVPHATNDMISDLPDYISYYDQFIRPFPAHEANIRYMYGDRKAMELGLLSSGEGH
jgi:hypothetical protein